MPTLSERARFRARLLVVLLVGCGGGDRPDAAGEGSAFLVSGDPGPSASSSDAGADARWPVCEPGTFSECRLYFQDAQGQMHCPASVALCRPDGKGFYGCGQYVMTESGPAPVDAGRPR